MIKEYIPHILSLHEDDVLGQASHRNSRPHAEWKTRGGSVLVDDLAATWSARLAHYLTVLALAPKFPRCVCTGIHSAEAVK